MFFGEKNKRRMRIISAVIGMLVIVSMVIVLIPPALISF